MKISRWIHVPWFLIAMVGLAVSLAADPAHGWRPFWSFGWCSAPAEQIVFSFMLNLWVAAMFLRRVR